MLGLINNPPSHGDSALIASWSTGDPAPTFHFRFCFLGLLLVLRLLDQSLGEKRDCKTDIRVQEVYW